MNVYISKIAIAIISIFITSCNVYNPITALRGSDATIVNSSNNNKEKNSTQKKSSKKKKNNKNKNTKYKPSTTAQNTTIEEYNISTTSQPIELINGEWKVFSVDGETISGEERPYIIFSEKENKIYGSNGCNIINGDYEATESGEITFINIISTMMACDNSPYENAINNAINNAAMYSITQDGHEYYMTISSFENQELLVLRKHNMDFLNGSWRVSEIKDKKNKNEGITLMLDIPELRLHGNTGCNI
ncbi:MAG: META domain-containing protein, partial [Muribaculaceae bacterium]|nr:META domain-containing protein [Muribaculaceae bacterium]